MHNKSVKMHKSAEYGVNYKIYPGAQSYFPVQAILHNMMHGICNIKMSRLNVSFIKKALWLDYCLLLKGKL